MAIERHDYGSMTEDELREVAPARAEPATPPSPASARRRAASPRRARSRRSAAHARLEARDGALAVAAASSTAVAPEADREPGERRRAERGHLEHARAARTGTPEHVGLELHQEVVAARAAVDAQRVERESRRRPRTHSTTSRVW